jgi:hypothetical protein
VDVSFLDVRLPALKRPRALLNFYDLLGLSGSELAADQTLAYFFDPQERHGMGTAMVDSLLLLLSRAPLLGAYGRVPETFDPVAFLGAPGWSIDRQVTAADPGEGVSTLKWSGIIDIYLTNRQLDLAIIVENKIGASLHNPLESYVRHAIDEGYGTVLLTVLAPYEHSLNNEASEWVSRPLTYGALFESMRTTSGKLDHDAAISDSNRRRSAELLEQFQEIRERRGITVDYASEAEFVNQFRQALKGRESALEEFFAAQQKINKIYRQRSELLRPLIDERLENHGLATGWEAHGHQSGRWTYAWNAYNLTESNHSVELILTPDPTRTGPITAKAYPGRDYKIYPNFDHIPIGVDWSSPNEDIADSFIGFALQVIKEHPHAS